MTVLKKDIQANKWVIGVSGGSDSMALLDICYREKTEVIVAHMNYQMRETADRDMDIVKDYCKQRNIPCFVKYQDEPCHHNFQAFARKKRYEFYRELIQEHQAKGVLLAHQLDDVLETYLMQKHRNSTPEYYGIKEENIIMGCLVERPLLEYTKNDLKEYCLCHQIPFGEDESNFSRKYTRNRIRMDVLQDMTKEEKDRMMIDVRKKNLAREEFLYQVKAFYESWDHSIDQLLSLTERFRIGVLDHMIYQNTHKHVSQKELHMILSLLPHKNFSRNIGEYEFQSSYGKLNVIKPSPSFAYVLNHVEFIKTPFFEVCEHGQKIESLTLSESDFPIKIRNAEKRDKIKMRFGTKSIHRWFIDRKIPADQRKIWPVVENAQGNIIFAAKIGCDIAHFSNNPTLFVIK